MWRRFPASGLAVRLTLFALFLAALALLKGYLAGEWRAGEARARAVLGEPAPDVPDTPHPPAP
jgi:hypothetical protein